MITLVSNNEHPPFFRYELNPKTGEYHRTSTHDELREAVTKARGFCDEREVGILQKRKVFAAIYALDGLLHTWVDNKHFTWPGEFCARRHSFLSRIKRFSISSKRRPVEKYVSIYYTFLDISHSFPGPEVVDIFCKIAWDTAKVDRINDWIEYWEKNATGINYWDKVRQE